MDHRYKNGKKSGEGIILTCPVQEKHTVIYKKQDLSGPSIVDCASCEYQTGIGYGIADPDSYGDYKKILPEKLKCGFLIR